MCVKQTTYEQLSCNHKRRMPLGKRRDSIAWEKTKPAKNRYRYEITLMIHNQVQTEKSGKEGGKLIFEGTPEELVKCKASYTAKFIKDKL